MVKKFLIVLIFLGFVKILQSTQNNEGFVSNKAINPTHISSNNSTKNNKKSSKKEKKIKKTLTAEELFSYYFGLATVNQVLQTWNEVYQVNHYYRDQSILSSLQSINPEIAEKVKDILGIDPKNVIVADIPSYQIHSAKDYIILPSIDARIQALEKRLI